MADIVHTLIIKADAESVFRAINTSEGVQQWWVDDAHTDGVIDGKAYFNFRDHDVTFNMKITELEENTILTWECSGTPEEWKDTFIYFRLTPHEFGTKLHFIHAKWKSIKNDFGACNYHWGLYLKSLKSYLETGKGNPTIHTK